MSWLRGKLWLVGLGVGVVAVGAAVAWRMRRSQEEEVPEGEAHVSEVASAAVGSRGAMMTRLCSRACDLSTHLLRLRLWCLRCD